MADNTVSWRSFSRTFGTGLDIRNISTFASLILFEHYSINWDLRKTLHSICDKIKEMDREVSGVFVIYFLHSGCVYTSNNYAVLGLAPCCIKFLAMAKPEPPIVLKVKVDIQLFKLFLMIYSMLRHKPWKP